MAERRPPQNAPDDENSPVGGGGGGPAAPGRRCLEIVRSFLRQWFRLLPLLGVGAAAGYALVLLHWPLPWLIGSMVVAALAALANRAPRPHAATRPIGQAVVGTAIGLSLDADAVELVVANFHLMVGAAFYTIAVGSACAVLLRRMARIDMPTAFFTSVPGGPVEMAGAADRFGGQGALVALAQTARISILVLGIPPAILWISGDVAAAPSSDYLSPIETILVLAAAISLGALARRCGLTTPWFLGPLTGGAIIGIAGLASAAMPPALVAAAQVLLGVSLGCQFTRSLFRQSYRFVIAAAFNTVLIIVAHIALAFLLLALSTEPITELVLATAPGSMTEMVITARALHHNVALVTAFHVTRLYIVLPLAPLLFRSGRRAVRRHRRRNRDP